VAYLDWLHPAGPLVGAIVLIVFYAQEGESGDNAYGANPKATPMAPMT
jgi:uncharacterized membrane protein YhaH (DUF805 family)